MDEFKLESKDIWNVVILISIGIVIVAGFMIINEYTSARKFCKENDGVFESVFPSLYYCDNISLYKYTDGWDYNREVDYSKLVLP